MKKYLLAYLFSIISVLGATVYYPIQWSQVDTNFFGTNGPSLVLHSSISNIINGTAGDVFYVNGSGNITKLPVGADGKVLKLSSGFPAWGVDITGTNGANTNSVFINDVEVIGINFVDTNGFTWDVSDTNTFLTLSSNILVLHSNGYTGFGAFVRSNGGTIRPAYAYITNLTLEGMMDGGGYTITNLADIYAEDGTFSGPLSGSTVSDAGGNLRTAIDGKADATDLDALEAIALTSDITNSLASFAKIHILGWNEGPVHIVVDPSLNVDWDSSSNRFDVYVTNDTFSVSHNNAPTNTALFTGGGWINFINIGTNDCDIELPWTAHPNRPLPVLKASQRGAVWFWHWRTNQYYSFEFDQSLPTAIEDGGTGVPTGIAPDGLDILGSVSYSATTNAEIDLKSGTVFRLDNTKDTLINTTASRLTSGETNTLEQVVEIEIVRPASDRIVWVNTNNFGLRGVEQSNYVAAGTSWRCQLVNWGSGSGESYLYGGGAGVAGGSGSSINLTNNIVFHLALQSASGPATDSTGNGWTHTERGGTFGWQATGLVDTYSITNGADTSLALTNASPSLLPGGNTNWTLAFWVQDALPSDNNNHYYLSRYNTTGPSAQFYCRTYSGNLWVGYSTNSVIYTYSKGSLGTGTNCIALVYDWTENQRLRIFLNGTSFSDVTLNAPLNDIASTVPFVINSLWDGTDITGNSPTQVRYGMFTAWSDVKTLEELQYYYNDGNGRTYPF